MRRLANITVQDLAAQLLFKDIEESILSELVDYCGMYKVHAGEQIITEHPRHGQNIKSLYIIQSGYVTVHTRTKYEAFEPSFLAWRGKGELLGEGRMLRPEFKEEKGFPLAYYPPDVMPKITATDVCQILGFPAHIFIALAKLHPIIYRNMVYILVDKNFRERLRTQVIQMRGTHEVPRVARTLKNLEIVRGYRLPPSDRLDAKILDGSIKTVDIAGYLGTGAEAVGDALRTLRTDQAIDFTRSGLVKGEIEIINSEQLDNY